MLVYNSQAFVRVRRRSGIESGPPRMVPYSLESKTHHVAIYRFYPTIALGKRQVFWQTMSNASILSDAMPADCIATKTNTIFYHKKRLEPQIAPKVTHRPNFASDVSAQSSDTTESNTF